MIIKKDIYDTVSHEELTELKLYDGILDVSSFLYRCYDGFGSLPHIHELIDFLFRNELIIKNAYVSTTFGPPQLDINFHINLHIGINEPHINIHNKKQKFKVIAFNSNLFGYILDNHSDCKVMSYDVVEDLIK